MIPLISGLGGVTSSCGAPLGAGRWGDRRGAVWRGGLAVERIA